jgi:hypothetical protein
LSGCFCLAQTRCTALSSAKRRALHLAWHKNEK